ncbi:MAG TPA: shikimate kinase [Solirubrobacteraceae bacterium]|nr:shikimate kinase [Solirubrobacteraceae bacterium]
MANERRQLVLIGMMGAGKTTVGRLVAATLGWNFWDNDEALFQATRQTAAQLQHGLGVSALHQTEDRLLREALAAEEPTVYAAAGSVVLQPEILNRVPTVWLRIGAAQEELNLAQSGQYHRPLPREAAPILEQLRDARADKYERFADAIVDVASTPEVTCERVIEALEEMT